MKSLVYAVKSSSMAGILHCIMDASMHRKKKQTLSYESVISLSGRAIMHIDNQGGHFKKLLHYHKH
jgi:hypothetical protein